MEKNIKDLANDCLGEMPLSKKLQSYTALYEYTKEEKILPLIKELKILEIKDSRIRKERRNSDSRVIDTLKELLDTESLEHIRKMFF